MLHNNKYNFEVYYPEDDERLDHNLTWSNYVLGEESDLDTAPTRHWVLLEERSQLGNTRLPNATVDLPVAPQRDLVMFAVFFAEIIQLFCSKKRTFVNYLKNGR